MKYLLPIVLFFAPCMADELESSYQQREAEIKIEQSEIGPDRYTYTRLGTTTLVRQYVGWGQRTIDSQTLSGTDLSLNLNFSPAALGWGTFAVAPTVEYDALYYRKGSNMTSYRGFGIEAGALLTYDRGRRRAYPIVNPKLIWGSEREGKGFSQVSLNLIPAGVLAISALMMTDRSGGYIPTATIGAIGLIASAPVLIDFTIGF